MPIFASFARIASKLRRRNRVAPEDGAEPHLVCRHGLERITDGFRQANAQAGIEPRDGKVALVAALMT